MYGVTHKNDCKKKVKKDDVDEPQVQPCPKCGEEMVIRVSQYGPFLSCSDRHCLGKRNINKWDRIMTHALCPECGQPMILRRGPKGSFLGCSAYPDCKKTLGIR